MRANTTPHERILWRALKQLPVDGTHFRRQAPIGAYIVDFFCPPSVSSLNSTVGSFWNSEVTGDLTAALERIYVELYGSREAEVESLKHRRGR
jgi:very-short-patch-repair endonuclease